MGRAVLDLNDLDCRSMIATRKPVGLARYTMRRNAASTPDLDVAPEFFQLTLALTQRP